MLIENWFIGDLSSNIPAFCTLDAKMVRHIKGASAVLRKMDRFMKFVEQMAKKKGCWEDGRSRKSQRGWTIQQVKALWGGIEKEFKKKYYPKKSRRKGELSWNTPYNQMKNPKEKEA